MRISRLRTAAACCGLASTLWLAAGAESAYAIGSDNGWTAGNNNNYPAGTSNPECQPSGGGPGCWGWSDDTAAGVSWADVNINLPASWQGTIYYNDAVNSINNFVNPLGSGVASINSPVYAVGGRGATVSVGASNIGAYCGVTHMTYVMSPPNNHGAFQQLTLNGGTVNLNTTKSYSDTGTINGTTCELRWTYNHEFGHTLGLGHTRYSNETMYTNNVAIYTAQTGDKHGVSCIYNLQNC